MAGGSTRTQAPNEAAVANERQLTARSSRVRIAGSTRVHPTVLEGLGMSRKDVVQVSAGTRHLGLHLFADEGVGHEEIVLRVPDMQRLHIGEGDRVTVHSYPRGREALAGSLRRLGNRVGARLDLTEPADRPTGGA